MNSSTKDTNPSEETRSVCDKCADDNPRFSETRRSESQEIPRNLPSDRSTDLEAPTEPPGTPKTPARGLRRRDRVSDAMEVSEGDNSGKLASRSKKSTEEVVESKWRKFWETNRDRFKHHKHDEETTKRRSSVDVTAEVVLREALGDTRLDEEEGSDKGNPPEGSSRNVESTSRRTKTTGRRDRPETLAGGPDDAEQGSVVDQSRSNPEKDEDSSKDGTRNLFEKERRNFEESIRGDPSPRRWSSLENLRAKLENAGGSSGSTKIFRSVEEGLSMEEPAKSKRTIGSLKSSFERKMGSVEKMLEDHMERILEENVEKHPWLLPIEAWLIDHCKTSGAHERRNVVHENDDTPRRLEVRYTANENEEEAKIESSRVESSRRTKMVETTRPEKPGQSVPRPRKNEQTTRVEETNMAAKIETETKDAKHHDLFDKFKDNVKEKMEDIHRYIQRINRLADVNRRLKSQIWSSVVTIVLVEAKNLLPMDIDGLSDPYVKFRLGTEKYKSKVVHKTLNPVWLEQFDLHLYEDPYLGQELEVTVWDRDKSHQDDLMGKAVIDLSILERETTHRLWRDLEDGSGSIFLLLTISGTTASETISDLAAHEETPREREQLYQRYAVLNTLQTIRDVGHLTVKVFKAQGLAAADLGGKSDPFCVLELVNARLQTQTEYKTLAPNWQKIFTFNVKDINSVLEVTVYDEDKDHKVEFLGKVAIPLLRIRNGEMRWYALKDKKLRGRAKGNSPQILLEMTVVWNVLRACIRTLNPKEKKYMEPGVRFKRQVFLRNVLRLKAIIIIFIDIGKYIQSCWEWESKMRSIIALVFFIFGCYYFEPYMIPVAALLILLRYYLVAAITGTPLSHHTGPYFHVEGEDGPTTPGDDDDDDDDKDKEEKKSLKERLQAIQDVTQTVQNSIGCIASFCERVKNLFNFTVPYLSYLAIMLMILAAAVLYFIPIRYLILAWGVNKFSRKIIRPHSVPNNEVLDLVSRVPDDEELLNYRELKPLAIVDCDKSSTSGSPGHSNLTRKRDQRKRQKA
ncbi:multiple C2 domain and transmembrane region protein isoform X2 [Ptiloglossa arizonensis]|uniref:multiple C2 domain and transmembrane region protein isoform X2 n=1 Tax=Ptiloglossa arizonensis TaxID=3350558 RepID=UPI003FA05C86